MVATFASAKQFILIGKEVTQGTAVAGTSTIPVEKFEWEDKPVWLDDKAMRGSMVESYARQTGVIKTDFSMSGPVFLILSDSFWLTPSATWLIQAVPRLDR